jgi:hypothetical protein
LVSSVAVKHHPIACTTQTITVVWLILGEPGLKKEGSLKNVFALTGKAKMGKSQTIRTVVEMLTTKYPDARFEYNVTTRVDTRVVLTIGVLKIGIESQSNPKTRLIKESLNLFERIGCDVIICATRTSGSTVDAVNALQGFSIQWLEQHQESQPYEQVLRNLAAAREIVKQVEVLIESIEQRPARSLSATA